MDYQGHHRTPPSRREQAINFGHDVVARLPYSMCVAAIGTFAVMGISAPLHTPQEIRLPSISERPNPQTSDHLKRLQDTIDRFLTANAMVFQPNVVCAPEGDSRTCSRFPGKSEKPDLTTAFQNRGIDSSSDNWQLVELDMWQPGCNISVVSTDAGGYELNRYTEGGELSETTLGNALSAASYQQLEDTVVGCINAESKRLKTLSDGYIRD